MADQRQIILAAQVSDEVVGCYGLLKEGKITDVVYFDKLDEVKINEAQNAAKTFGFNIYYNGMQIDLKDEDQLYIPCRYDTHALRRYISLKYRGFRNVLFYSIEKNFKNSLLPELVQKDKKVHLDFIYPSQQEVWAADQKAYTFETILDTDYLIRSYINFNCGHVEFSVSFEANTLNYEDVREYLVDKLTGVDVANPVEVGKKLMSDLESKYDTNFTVEIDNKRDRQRFIIS